MERWSYYFSKLIRKIQIPAIKNSKISKKSKIMAGCHVVNSNVNDYSYVGYDTSIINTNVGKFCSIAGGCSIGGASHPMTWISTSPVFHAGKNCLRKNFSELKYEDQKITTIGNDVWIGEKCLIKAGITIGDGAVIGMGSVLTKDVDFHEIWAGNPARLIRRRFDKATSTKLMNLEWWNYEEEILCENKSLYSEVIKFINEKEELRDKQ